MSVDLERLGRHTIVYGLSTVAVQLLGFVTIPVMARELTAAQYGTFELALTGMSFAAVFADLGLASASQRSFYDYREPQHDARRVVLSTTFVIELLSATAVASVLMLLRLPIAAMLFGDRSDAGLVVIMAASLPVLASLNFSREVMRLRFLAWRYVAVSTLAAAAGAASVVVALVVLHLGVRGALTAIVIGSAVAAGYGLWVVRPSIGHHVSRLELAKMLRYGLPLVPAALALWALSLVDRIMLAKLSSLSQVGEYAMANRLGLIMTLAGGALATSFSPFMLELHGDDPDRERVVRAEVLLASSVAFATLTVFVSLFAREALLVIAPRFKSAYEGVGLVAYGLAAFAISNVVLGGISIARETRSLIRFSATAAVLNVALNLVLIPSWGMMGAAFATAASYLLLLLLYYRKAQAVSAAPYALAKLSQLAMLSAVPTAVGALPIAPLGLALAIKSVVAIVFIVVLAAAGLLPRAYLSLAMSAWRRNQGQRRRPPTGRGSS